MSDLLQRFEKEGIATLGAGMSQDLDAIFRTILKAKGHDRREAVGIYADALEAVGDDAGAWMFRQEDCPMGMTSDELRELSRSRVVMQRIRAGELLMGSPDHDKFAWPDEKPRHTVMLTMDFELGVFPVTQRQYQRVIEAYPLHSEGRSPTPSRNSGNPDHPVENVSWWDAAHFCNMLSVMEKKRPYYEMENDAVERNAAADGYRLPTEAEWEFACRAGSTTSWPWGDTLADLEDSAWYDDNSGGKTHPAGKKRPNCWGLYDTLGNVWEWCDDSWGRAYSRSDMNDPMHVNGADRVCRGGGWPSYPQCVRPAFRFRGNARMSCNYLGFRVAGTCT